jgi:hypothetical protein
MLKNGVMLMVVVVGEYCKVDLEVVMFKEKKDRSRLST